MDFFPLLHNIQSASNQLTAGRQQRRFVFALAVNLILNCAGANGAEVETQTNTAYLQKIQQKLEHNWCPAKGAGVRATVTFRVNQNGQITWVEISNASPVGAVNEAAKNAVYYSAPFNIPAGSRFIDIAADFTSDYCPKFGRTYSSPTAANIENSAKLYASTIDAKNKGEFKKALDSLQQANQIVPENIHIRDSLIALFWECAKSAPKEEAISMLHKALLLDPYNDSTRRHLNSALLSVGKDPSNYELRVSLARDYERDLHYEEALCEYGEAWLIQQDQTLIPEINLACQREANCAEIYKWQHALKLANSATYHTQLGLAYENCDDLKNAEAQYLIAKKLNSEDWEAQSGLDRVQSKFRDGNNKPAIPVSPELRDDFPYTKFGNCKISLSLVKNRQWTSRNDYLTAACGNHLTRWANDQTAFRIYVADGRNIPGYHPDYRQIMIDAFGAWVKASDNRLSYKIVNSPQQANIACYWFSKPSGEMTANELGLTKSSFIQSTTGPNLMISAQVFIVTIDKQHGRPLPPSVMKSVCLHEFGHTLGINGHSPHKGDVMYASVSPYLIPTSLSERDCETIQRLYHVYDAP